MTKLFNLPWVFWLYFLWRFYQHYRELRDTTIRDAYRTKMSEFLLPIARERYKQVFKPSSTYLTGATKKFRFSAATWAFHKPWHVTVDLPASVEYQEESGAFALDSERARIIEFRWKELLWPEVKAALFVLKNMSQFTEYYLPFAVALIPLVYVVVRPGWNWLVAIEGRVG